MRSGVVSFQNDILSVLGLTGRMIKKLTIEIAVDAEPIITSTEILAIPDRSDAQTIQRVWRLAEVAESEREG